MTQQESVVTRTRKSTKAVRVSWRHAFSEKFALRTGLEWSSETVEQSLETSENTQAFAQLSANLPPNGRLVLGGSLYQGGSHSRASAEDASRDRSQTLSVFANHSLINGWNLSGSLSVPQSQYGHESAPFYSRFGNLRLSRDF